MLSRDKSINIYSSVSIIMLILYFTFDVSYSESSDFTPPSVPIATEPSVKREFCF